MTEITIINERIPDIINVLLKYKFMSIDLAERGTLILDCNSPIILKEV